MVFAGAPGTNNRTCYLASAEFLFHLIFVDGQGKGDLVQNVHIICSSCIVRVPNHEMGVYHGNKLSFFHIHHCLSTTTLRPRYFQHKLECKPKPSVSSLRVSFYIVGFVTGNK